MRSPESMENTNFPNALATKEPDRRSRRLTATIVEMARCQNPELTFLTKRQREVIDTLYPQGEKLPNIQTAAADMQLSREGTYRLEERAFTRIFRFLKNPNQFSRNS